MKTDDICKEAYYLWESQGRPHGRDQEFWFQAELLLKSQLVPTPKAPTAPKVKRVGKATAPVSQPAAAKASNGTKPAAGKTAPTKTVSRTRKTKA